MAEDASRSFLSITHELHENQEATFDRYLSSSNPIPIEMGLLFANYDNANFILRSRDVGRTYWFGLEVVHGRSLKDEYAFQVMEHWLVDVNPPAHTRLRKLMQTSFSSAHVDSLKEMIADIADGLLRKIKLQGEFDIVKDFALPLPVMVICRMLGIPRDDVPMFLAQPLVDPRLLDPIPFERAFLDDANQKFYQLRDYFFRLFRDRREHPRDDMISMLVHAHSDGDRLSEDELLANVILLFFAGHETTTSLIAAGCRELFLHPDQLARLRAQNDLMENAVFEMLRVVSVAQMTIYTALKNIECNGSVLEVNKAAWIWLASANRDARVFKNPHQFDITRENAKKLLSFGGGIHYCLGAHLAKIETMIAIEKLLTTFPKLRLLNLDKPLWRKSISLKALEEQRAQTH